MKLAFAKDIDFVKRTNGKSPLEIEQEIIDKVSPTGLIYSGLILPFKGSTGKYRVTHPDTGEFKDYAIKHFNNFTGTELFSTEKAALVSIKWKCEKLGKEFVEWDGGWKGFAKTKAVIMCKEHGRTLNPKLVYALKDDVPLACSGCRGDIVHKKSNGGKTRHEVRQEKQAIIESRCEKMNYTFKGFSGDLRYSYATKFVIHCNKHNVTWESTKCTIHKFTCPECRKEQLIQLSNRTYTDKANFYIQLLDDKFIKFGVTTRDIKIRMYEQTRKSNFNHKLIFLHEFAEGWKALDLEHEVKQRFKTHAVPYKDLPDGWSETLTIDELPHLQQLVYDFLTNPPDEADMWVSPKDIFDEDTFKLHTHFYGINKPEFFCVDDDNPDLMDDYFYSLLDAA